MKFIKKYLYFIFVGFITLGLGVVSYLTSQKLQQQSPVAPNVPQEFPQAVEPACKLTFKIKSKITPTPTFTPTPTPTVTPTGTITPTLTPTPTSTPTPTPTTQPNSAPDCTGLSVSPNTGSSVPMDVSFTCSGADRGGLIMAAEFNFRDTGAEVIEKNAGSPGSIDTTHTFTQFGSYAVYCRVRDNDEVYSSIPDACKKTVTITKPATGGTRTVVVTQPPEEEPEPTATPIPRPIVLVVNTPTPTPARSLGFAPTATPTPLPPAFTPKTTPIPPAPTEGPKPKVPVAGGPSVIGISALIGGFLLVLLGLAL